MTPLVREGDAPATWLMWPELLTADERTRLIAALVALYGVGVLGGAYWGGWKGAFAGLLGATALKNAYGASVYAGAPGYNGGAWLLAGLAVVEAGGAAWLGTSAASDRSARGLPAFI